VICGGTGEAGDIPRTYGEAVGAYNEFALCLLAPGIVEQ
jgi:hypothetical protein